jgi:hypothetical protein
MKRVFLLFASITAILFSVSGYARKDRITVQSDDGKITVTAAIFPPGDFVRVAVKDKIFKGVVIK